MTRAFLILLALVAALLFATTARRLLRSAGMRKSARAGFFDGLAPSFTDPVLRLEPSGFPRLGGVWQGRPYDLQAVPDTLTFRKLPALWLLVTLIAPQPVKSETRIMARPSGQEPFSKHGALPFTTALPAGFPDHCSLKTTAPQDVPPPALLAMIAPLFDDPAVKEVVVSQKGLRIVLLVEEAPRGSYLIYRDAELGLVPLRPDIALRATETLMKLEACLADET